MSKKRQEKSNMAAFKKAGGDIYAAVVRMYLVALIGIYPLIILPVWIDKDKGRLMGGYFTILTDKYIAYVALSLMALGCLFLLAMVFAFVDAAEFGRAWMRQSFQNLRSAFIDWKAWLPEWSSLLFAAAAAISTLVSMYRYESFWGNEGRQMGLFLILLMVAGFLAVSRYLRPGRWYLDMFLLSIFCACVFGIIQYLGFDCFYLRKGTTNPTVFISSFGNINTYTSVVAMGMAASAVLYAFEHKCAIRRCGYYVAFVVTCVAIITGNSDNAYLSIAALFAALPFFLWRGWRGLARYLLLVIGFLGSLKVIYAVNLAFPEQVNGVGGLFEAIAPRTEVWILLALLLALTGTICLVGRKRELGSRIYKAARLGWLILLCLAFLAVCYLLFDVNVRGNEARYEGLLGYLKFDDEWGTHRGFIWRTVMECYKDFPPLQKVFGYGPDTTGIFLRFSEFRQISIERYQEYVENAHNDYLQYLVTIGPVGLLSYLLFIGSCSLRLLKVGYEGVVSGDGEVLAVFFVALCFSCQAVVNISSPINVPLLWGLLGLGMAYCRTWKESGFS